MMRTVVESLDFRWLANAAARNKNHVLALHAGIEAAPARWPSIPPRMYQRDAKRTDSPIDGCHRQPRTTTTIGLRFVDAHGGDTIPGATPSDEMATR